MSNMLFLLKLRLEKMFGILQILHYFKNECFTIKQCVFYKHYIRSFTLGFAKYKYVHVIYTYVRIAFVR